MSLFKLVIQNKVAEFFQRCFLIKFFIISEQRPQQQKQRVVPLRWRVCITTGRKAFMSFFINNSSGPTKQILRKTQRGGAKLTSSHLKLKFPSPQWEIKNSEVLIRFKAN